MTSRDPVETSVCIVSLNCWPVLKDCLQSLRSAAGVETREVILVDNASSDGTPSLVRQNFPEVELIENDKNVGFTKATNQAIRRARGKFLLWLNPDTIVRPDSLRALEDFLDRTPAAGIVGPKVLNPDGSFQPQCRRGMPTPAASLFHVLRLDRIWPRSPIAGQYLLTFFPVEDPASVVSVSGCCLMARREVWDQVGPLDEAMFGFGEDIDWCLRTRAAGWEVWYFPGSTIVHLKGQGGVHSKPYHKVWGIHQCMWLVYRKYFAPRYHWPVTALVWLGVATSFALSVLTTSIKQILRSARSPHEHQ